MREDTSEPLPTTPQVKKIGVLLVDDHAVVRQGLRMFIEMQKDMEVIGEGSNGIEAVELSARLKPDVILLDLLMPEMDGVNATRMIMDGDPHSRVLILTSFGEDDNVFPAIRAGAQGYLLKDIQPGELVHAIRETYQGKAQLHPDVARRLASMSSGLDCTNEADEKTLKEMVASPDYVQFVLDRKVAWAPGEHFVYCSPAIHILSPILQQATGMTTLDFARQYLFEPLGIHDAMLEQDPQGYYDGWGDLSLHPQDMAKIGFLFLNKGQWDGKQIISSKWVEEASQAHMDTGGDPHGYGWWVDPAVEGAFRADGRGGQFIYVLPKWNMIVVTTGGGFGMD
jgi:DNA-binding NarL/FixJ family response regulator